MDLWHATALSIALCGLAQLSPAAPKPAATPLASLAPLTTALRSSRAAAADPVVFVVLDGVRWQEIFRGSDEAFDATLAPRLSAEALMPTLHAQIENHGAVIGAPGRGSIAASGPRFVSLPSYREIFSGMASLDCLDNGCAPIERPTLVDELRAKGGSASVFSSWPVIARAVAQHGDGATISAGLDASDHETESYPGEPGFRPDALTAKAALAHLEREHPDFLFLGLGEPDEYAHKGDYPAYLGSLRAADRTLAELVKTLERMGERGARTHVFVTTDHGRAKGFRDHGGAHPESAAVWLAAWGPTIVARGALVTTTPHHLRDLAPTARVVLGLPSLPASPERGVVLDELL